MKNLFALLFSSLIALSLNSQSIINDFETPFLTNKNLKSIQATKQQLDSIVADFYNSNTNEWHAWLQATYAYDEFGNLTKYIDYSHSSEGVIPYTKKEFSYTEKGNISQQLIFDWNSNTSAYVLHYQEDYVYNSSGQLVEFIILGDWEDKLDNTVKVVYLYDNGNLLSYIRYEWKNLEWAESSKVEYIYDGTSLINQKYSRWSASNSQFEINTDYNYYYNSDDHLSKTESYRYYSSDSLKTIYEYNEQNTLTSSLKMLKGENNGSWLNDWKTIYVYDDEMNMLEASSYNWNPYNSEWDFSIKKAYAFAENANLTAFTYYDGAYTDDLIPQYKYEYEYDDSFSFEDLVLPSIEKSYNSGAGLSYSLLYYDSIENKHMKTSHSLYWWNVNDQEWKIDNNSSYYYSEKLIDGVQESIKDGIVVYPNPASDFIVFEILSSSSQVNIMIYDIQGKVVLDQDLSNQKISIKGWKSGLYLYQVILNNKKISGKFLVE